MLEPHRTVAGAATTCGSMAYFNPGTVKPGGPARMSFPVGQMCDHETNYKKTYNGYDKTDAKSTVQGLCENSGNEITTISMPSPPFNSERMGCLRHDYHYPCCNQ